MNKVHPDCEFSCCLYIDNFLLYNVKAEYTEGVEMMSKLDDTLTMLKDLTDATQGDSRQRKRTS